MSDRITFSRRAVFALPLPFALAACQRGPQVFSLTGQTMGTRYTVVAIDETRNLAEADVQGAIDGALAVVNAQMSNWDAGSDISRINFGSTESVTLAPALAEVMAGAEAVHLASEGRFDVTMGPLIELWGFGAAGGQAMPGESAIELAMTQTGHANVLDLSGDVLRKRAPEAQIYLAAIGKGYGADHIGRALAGLGIRDFMVEIGGDLYAQGRNPEGQPWQIGVETPSAHLGGVHDVVGLTGMGLASSGDYRNFFEADGTRYSHVIDPMTGRPITHATTSATVIAETAMLADAWSTAMLTLGRERGLEIAEEQGLAVMFIERDDAQGFITTASTPYQGLIG